MATSTIENLLMTNWGYTWDRACELINNHIVNLAQWKQGGFANEEIANKLVQLRDGLQTTERKLHIRIDDAEHSPRQFACGIGPELPADDVYFFEAEPIARSAAYLSSHPEVEACPGCFPDGKPQLGTPISQLSGRPGHPGYDEFCRIAQSWGHE